MSARGSTTPHAAGRAPGAAAAHAGAPEPDGRRYWRSLEELAAGPELEALLARELPRHAAALGAAVDRRQFLKLMSASLALAGVGACTRQPTERIVPYARAPEHIVPGEPLFFATAMPLAGGATGLLVESHMGRPTKVEGNPEHPASLGATDAFAQAAVLGLYDPDRAQVITSAGEIRPWSAFLAALGAALELERPRRGAGLRILTETVTSPTLTAQLGELLTAFPAARWHQYEPTTSEGARAGARLALGADADAQYRLERAEVILSLDHDFLAAAPGSLALMRAFSARRRAAAAGEAANRLYVVDTAPTLTGAKADHRLALRASAMEDLALAVAAAVGADSGAGAPPATVAVAAHAPWIAALARDLAAHRGRSVVMAGATQPATVHALAHAMNHVLGNVGRTVVYTEPVAALAIEPTSPLADLVRDMQAGEVELLLILGGNPVLTAPADLRFADHLARVGMRVHVGLYDDETSLLCHWHVPEAHFLESWSDVRAADGTASIVQPLIAPLYDGKTAHEVLAACAGHPERSSYELVRDYWKRQHADGDFERFWRRALHDGVVAGTALPAKTTVRLRPDWAARVAAARAAAPAEGTLDVVFRTDPSVFDGRFANNGWLQELPRPVTKLTWENAALVSPATAARLGVASEDVVELRHAGAVVEAPIWVTPGHADDALTVTLGYGRTRAGRIGTGIGFDAYRLRTSAAPWFGRDLEVVKTGRRAALASTQAHDRMEGRHLVREATLAAYRAHPEVVHEMAHEPPAETSLYASHPYPGHAWGMAIDLAACTGCNACVIACQAENNIPIVGKAEVARGREMHWIRIDRYFEGEPAAPAIRHQPVLCMHCEQAPCEVVCPVNATVHSGEGLNDMVYNRCVGTKYCSNNCPYKVRRFNFYLYNDWTTESLKMARNPDVTVRSRGVMEKCSYCVQRIEHGRIQAKKEDRAIRDGDIVTACQQACPAEAIVFGDVNDPESRVARLKAEPRNYGLLADLNTRPRTTYLAVLTNPNPELDRA
jgi:molybdopterin-containing oxidoreductase family iron-sulfur binding subunit